MTSRLISSPFLNPLSREAIGWVVRLKSGEATIADAAAFRSWKSQSAAHAEACAEAVKLWVALGPAAAPLFDVERTAAKAGVSKLPRRAVLGGAIAASVALAAVRPPLGLWPSVMDAAADFETAKGERQKIALADGIDAELNTQTSLSVRPAASPGESRFRLLSGEAVITASFGSDKKVIVEAGEGFVSASTATFSTRCAGENVDVTCLTGVTAVSFGNRKTVLPASQKISYSRDGLGATIVADIGVETAWRSGLLIFQERPLRDAIAEINRYRRGKIVLLNSELEHRLVNGTFYIDRPDEIVAQIQQLFSAKVTSFPGGIVILS